MASVLLTKIEMAVLRYSERSCGSTITNPDHQTTMENNPQLGNLSILPLEIRSNIYSFLLSDDYKHEYSFGPDGPVVLGSSSDVSLSFLNINRILSEEMLGALTAGRHCKVRIKDDKLVTNFPLHKVKARTRQELQSFSIPTCKRIDITIDPPSPREAHHFYTLRQNIQAFINIINSGASDINPQICVRLDRTGLQCTYSYNDFAMFFGPFVGLSNRCKAVIVFRTTGLPNFSPTVEGYCNLIEAAMSFDLGARRELMLHQYQIDIKLPLALLPYKRLNYNHLDDFNRPAWLFVGTAPQLNYRQFKLVAASVCALIELYNVEGKLAPEWVLALSRHIVDARAPNHIPPELHTLVLESKKASDMELWAAGLISRYNPFFDDVPFFKRQQNAVTASDESATQKAT